MDTLHGLLRSIRTETKSGRDHLTVFREFLAQLDALQRAPMERPRVKPPRRKAIKRAKGYSAFRHEMDSEFGRGER